MKGNLYRIKYYIKINDIDWICYKESKIKYSEYCAPKGKEFEGSVIQFKEKAVELDWVTGQDLYYRGEHISRTYTIKGLTIDEKLIKSVKFKNVPVKVKPSMSYNELKDEMEVGDFFEMINREI